MNIFKKIGSVISSTWNNLTNKISGSSQTATVNNANKTISSGGLTYKAKDAGVVQSFLSNPYKDNPAPVDIGSAIKSGGLSYGVSTGVFHGPQLPKNKSSILSQTRAGMSPNLTTSGSYSTTPLASNLTQQMNILSGSFTSGSAPTTASNISMGTPKVNIPDIPYSSPNISNAKAELEASEKQIENEIKVLSEREQLEQENRSILDELLSRRRDPVNVRKEMENYFGIQAQQAKVASLSKDLNALVAAKDQQVAAILNSPYGVMDFTNNRVAQIERNAAPQINKLSADIKFETALLTQKYEFVQQAVDDYFREEDRQLNLFGMYMEQNEKTIARLDIKEQNALNQAFELKKIQLYEEKEMRMKMADYAFKYPQAGIDWQNDNPMDVQRKLMRAGVGEVVTAGESMSGVEDILLQELSEGQTPEWAARVALSQLEALGIKTTSTMLNELTKQARELQGALEEYQTAVVQPEKEEFIPAFLRERRDPGLTNLDKVGESYNPQKLSYTSSDAFMSSLFGL
jgi:hypothetical protein